MTSQLDEKTALRKKENASENSINSELMNLKKKKKLTNSNEIDTFVTENN